MADAGKAGGKGKGAQAKGARANKAAGSSAASQVERTAASRTKADLVELVYRSHGGITKAEAAEVVDSIFQTMKSSLLDGQAVKIQNFGVFEVVPRQGRMGVDPSSGERIFIPPRNGLSFRPAHRLKEAVFKPGGSDN